MYLLTIRTKNKLGIKFEASAHLDRFKESLLDSPLETEESEECRGLAVLGDALGRRP